MKRSFMVNQKSDITFLINSLGEGGAQRAMVTLAKQFIKEGKTVTILCLAKNDFYTLPSEVNLVYFSDSVKDRMFLIPYYAWKLKQYVEKYEITMVHSYLFRANYVNLFSRLLGLKHQIQVANRSVVSRFFKEGFSGTVNILLIKWLYPNADLIIHQSERMKLDFHEHFKMENFEEVVYNSFDVPMILSQAQKEVTAFTFEPTKRYLIGVGRLIALKRFQDIIWAMKDLPLDVELILLGEGREELALKSLAKELGLEKRVHFLGQVENPFGYIKRSDIFISSSSVEGFPNVLVEAMLCQTVVISSDCMSGPREIMAPKTKHSTYLLEGVETTNYGLLYPVGSVESLHQAIQELLEDTTLQERYRQEAFIRAQSFSVEAIVSQYLKILFEV